MRSSTTTIETGRTRVRTGVAPSTTIRVQRTTDTSGRAKPSKNRNSNSTANVSNASTSTTGVPRHRISQHLSTDVPPIPPRTRQTNGGGINLSRSQGIHTNISGGIGSSTNSGITQTRNHQRAPIQSLSRTNPQFSQTQPQSRRSNNNLNTSSRTTTSQMPRNQTHPRATPSTSNNANTTTTTNRNTENNGIFPRPPPASEAVRRRLQRNNTSTTNSQANIHNNTNSNAQITNTNQTTREETAPRLTNYNRIPTTTRTINSPPSTSIQHPRHATNIAPGEPIIPVPNPQPRLIESQNRNIQHQPSPSDNVGSTREPQVILRTSTNVSPLNRQTTTTNPSNARNTNNNANIPVTNVNQRQTAQPPTNTNQQRNARPTFANVGTRATPNNNNPQNDNIMSDLANDESHLGLFDELFSILDNFPINIIPLIPVMFENSFGPFLERVIPLYLEHFERNQIIRAIDESMREAAIPKVEPPKKVKLINHIINAEDTKEERGCAICLSDFAAGEQTVMLKCGHFFHKDCLMPWFLEHHTCPTCRENIDETLIENSEENRNN